MGFLTFGLSPTALFFVPAVPALLAAWNLQRLAKRVAVRSREPGTGFLSERLRAFDVYNKFIGEFAFEEAIRLMELPRRRWLVFRRLALGVLILSWGVIVIVSLT